MPRKQEKEKTKIIVKTLKEIKETVSSDLQSYQQHIFLIQGIALGLFYGIIGNLLISHYYGVFEGLVKAEYNGMFWANLFILVVGLALIIVVSIKWHNQLEKFKSWSKQLSHVIDQMNVVIDSYTHKEDMEVLEG